MARKGVIVRSIERMEEMGVKYGVNARCMTEALNGIRTRLMNHDIDGAIRTCEAIERRINKQIKEQQNDTL